MLASGGFDCRAHAQRFSNTLTIMYVARDKDGTLWLYTEKPRREEESGLWFLDINKNMQINSEEFPQLKWEDEPIEVKLINQS